jgi:hypothetical protein
MPRSRTTCPWARYEPTSEDSWDLRKVAHLHLRAGFGATWTELLRDREAGPDASVDHLFQPRQLTTVEAEADEAIRRVASLDLIWINSGTLLERTNWAADVVWGRSENGLTPFDPVAWAAHYKLSPDRTAGALMELLLQSDLGNEGRRLTLDAGRDGTAVGLRKALQRLANCPEFQLA